jgi:hypothetical protein
MIRIALVTVALLGIGTLAQASTVSDVNDIVRNAQIVEAKKCKAGFRLNSRNRCVAKPTPKPNGGGSSGGSGSFF